MSYKIGVDVGGTFTDGIIIDDETGHFAISKVSSTPANPATGFMQAVSRSLAQFNGVDWRDISYLMHGTTVATNAVLERKTAKAAFLTTAGFRDMLEIARQMRSSLYELQFQKPKPLISRDLCFEVPERLNSMGEVVLELDEDAVRGIGHGLRSSGVESVAICLLHAYRNPVHENRVAKLLWEVHPELMISKSSDVAPEFREYFRASTTVINAVVRPHVTRYLEDIEKRVRAEGSKAGLLVMQSNGGVTSFQSAGQKPVYMVESGPAAGVVGASKLIGELGYRDAFSFDMGGTTAKVGLIRDGVARVVRDYELGDVARAGRSGGGYPIRTPVIDLLEIGAGGGSLAWTDEGGSLRVGPQSAGADPGPACYGRGGTSPTVTDANLALGYLNPEYFLGGAIELDTTAAERAITEHCAKPLDLSMPEAAYGILRLANAAMANAFRLISVQRGYDPRKFMMVAFGGAGPLHANSMAKEMGIPCVAIPPGPGVFSAMGLVSTDVRHDSQEAVLMPTADMNDAFLNAHFATLERSGERALDAENVGIADLEHERQIDMRYVGQGYELTIPAPAAQSSGGLGQLVSRFHDEHERAFGYSAPGEPTEIVNLRVATIGAINQELLPKVERESNLNMARKGTRRAYFEDAGDFVSCDVFDRYLLAPGDVIAGPSIIEEMDATTVLLPSYAATVDSRGVLLIRELDGRGNA